MTITVRIPTPADWPAILDAANAALPWDPEGNQEWLEYRKQFDEAKRIRRHYVAEDPTTGQVIGYGALEEGPDFGVFRVFVVMSPERLRSEAGALIYERLAADLEDLEARGAWAREYTSDTALVAFLQEHDFFEMQRFTPPGSPEMVVLGCRLED
jgi:L-amino acid N-acyltransferase YncA